MPHFDMGKILQMLPDLAVLAAVYLLVLLPRWRRAGGRTLAVRTAFFLYLVCVLGVTLLPVLGNLPKLAGNRYVPMELEPFRDLRNGYGNAARQLVLNVVMTVPFGFLWPLVRQRRGLWRTVLAAFLLSLGIEFLQPLLTTHRTADITDLIANTVGGLAGYLLFLPFAGPLLRLCRTAAAPLPGAIRMKKPPCGALPSHDGFISRIYRSSGHHAWGRMAATAFVSS